MTYWASEGNYLQFFGPDGYKICISSAGSELVMRKPLAAYSVRILLFVLPLMLASTPSTFAHGHSGGGHSGGGHSSGSSHSGGSGWHPYHYGHGGYGHRYGYGGGGGGYYDEPYEHPYYAGSDSRLALQNYYNNKVAAANGDLADDQAQLSAKAQEYQLFASKAQAYEAALAKQITNYREVYGSVERRLAQSHNPKEQAQLRQWLKRESELEAEASKNIQTEDAWVRNEQLKVNNAAHNVSEDQEQISDYSRLNSQMRRN